MSYVFLLYHTLMLVRVWSLQYNVSLIHNLIVGSHCLILHSQTKNSLKDIELLVRKNIELNFMRTQKLLVHLTILIKSECFN